MNRPVKTPTPLPKVLHRLRSPNRLILRAAICKALIEMDLRRIWSGVYEQLGLNTRQSELERELKWLDRALEDAQGRILGGVLRDLSVEE